MTAKSNAYPELVRVLKFFPLVVDNPRYLNRKQIEDYNEVSYCLFLSSKEAEAWCLMVRQH